MLSLPAAPPQMAIPTLAQMESSSPHFTNDIPPFPSATQPRLPSHLITRIVGHIFHFPTLAKMALVSRAVNVPATAKLYASVGFSRPFDIFAFLQQVPIEKKRLVREVTIILDSQYDQVYRCLSLLPRSAYQSARYPTQEGLDNVKTLTVILRGEANYSHHSQAQVHRFVDSGMKLILERWIAKLVPKNGPVTCKIARHKPQSIPGRLGHPVGFIRRFTKEMIHIISKWRNLTSVVLCNLCIDFTAIPRKTLFYQLGACRHVTRVEVFLTRKGDYTEENLSQAVNHFLERRRKAETPMAQGVFVWYTKFQRKDIARDSLVIIPAKSNDLSPDHPGDPNQPEARPTASDLSSSWTSLIKSIEDFGQPKGKRITAQ
ncbi:hypothetical protein IAU59_003255 [Kwoniella sp. CBS 9459]